MERHMVRAQRREAAGSIYCVRGRSFIPRSRHQGHGVEERPKSGKLASWVRLWPCSHSLHIPSLLWASVSMSLKWELNLIHGFQPRLHI